MGMGTENFEIDRQAGETALERGEYRAAVDYFTRSLAEIAPNSRQGGEIQILLVTALQASGQIDLAITRCQSLLRHPRPDIRQSSKQILYIMQAPELKRPQEWMTEIPDLTNLDDDFGNSAISTRTPTSSTKNLPKSPLEKYENPIDLSQVNTQDNGFVWVAGIAIVVVLAGLVIANHT
jgi:tetratricopeptide (TPR) repeat protein